MTRVRIGILFGGRSEEHPVSIKSAREVAASLDPERYEPVWIGISAGGAWRLCAGADVDLDDAELPTAVLSPDPATGGLLVLRPEGVEVIPLDVVFPVLHGRQGEDGAMQGLLELSGIPYIGCDIPSSVLAMDKQLAYVVAAHAGIATPAFRVVDGAQSVDAGGLEFPVFVKPARSGSSFGVTKVTRPDGLADALDAARRYDAKVLIEQAVVGSEVGCAILGDESGLLGADELVVGEVDRIALTHGFFRIHQEQDPERGSDNSTPIVPADIPPESRALVQQTAKAVYRALGCRGLARVDLFLTADGSVVLNEVNTLPGLTSYSRYPRMMAAAGLPLGEVIDRLVALALSRRPR
jgi:D-alanine--(R)-lactate ligase